MIRSFPTTLMQDPVFRLRTPDARLVLFTLWMHPSNHLSGPTTQTTELPVTHGLG